MTYDQHRRVVLSALAVLALFLTNWASGSAHAILTAHLHEGTCADLGSTPVELGELGYVTPLLDPTAATPVGPYQQLGSEGAFPTVLGYGRVNESLDQLLDAPHAVDVHIINDEEGIDITLACGAVGGVRGDGQLVFGLQATTSEAVDTTGIAWLQESADGTTALRVFVAQGLAEGGYGAAGTPTP